MGEVEVVRLDLPASYRYLAVLDACLGAVPFDAENVTESVLYNIRLAAHEVCTNIIDHAYEGREDGRILLSLIQEKVPQRLIVELRDHGRCFDPRTVPKPDLEQPQEHGYGLMLIYALMDQVEYEPGAQGNYWRLVKNL